MFKKQEEILFGLTLYFYRENNDIFYLDHSSKRFVQKYTENQNIQKSDKTKLEEKTHTSISKISSEVPIEKGKMPTKSPIKISIGSPIKPIQSTQGVAEIKDLLRKKQILVDGGVKKVSKNKSNALGDTKHKEASVLKDKKLMDIPDEKIGDFEKVAQFSNHENIKNDLSKKIEEKFYEKIENPTILDFSEGRKEFNRAIGIITHGSSENISVVKLEAIFRELKDYKDAYGKIIKQA